ncbi:OmpH family outer membrane protein [Ulvibacter antarcticus]|uniref:Periplasmic chaperone for outer membrane proteins Skp n=1 Tax=Ulvibacter antarcticus TaxID=442714 RepID=A0A3L9YIR9_9FLAO|nr:OmpH family outer membrane protein [Ulvibacter antarcticus]RMA58045.1 periplasmic chaperone for outer membrane proteins Skp [Ulvibacter antarcticus]
MKLIKILFLFISISTFAQSKVGTIDIDYVLSKMPNLAGAQAQVDAYGQGLDTDLKKKFDSYNVLIEAYKNGEAGFTAAVKNEKQQEIAKIEDDINKFQQNGGQLIKIKRDEVLRPFYEKIGASLDKISKTEGFTQVFQISNDIVYIDATLDLTIKVLTDLGITVKEGE